MHFIKIYPFLLLLGVVLCTETGLDKIDQELEFNENLPFIETFSHESCTNMTLDQMNVVLSYYPNVKVRCEAERSVLIPTVLQIPENYNNNFDDENTWYVGRNKFFYFNEIKLVLEANATNARVPISPCVRTLGTLGRGSYEISFSLRMLLLGLGLATRSIPLISSLGVFKGTRGYDGEITYNVLCSYHDTNVRPVVEVTTIKTHELLREWTVEPSKKSFVKYSEWEPLDRVRVIEDTLMFACISERNVSQICSWRDHEVIDGLKDRSLQPIFKGKTKSG